MLSSNCRVARKLIFVLFFVVPMWVLFLTESLFASEGDYFHEDRLAALECQRNGFVVIVNYYSGGRYLLTAGEEDNFRVIDLPVKLKISQPKNLESYSDSNVLLTLPLDLGTNSDQIRLGKVKIKNPTLEVEGLKCLLHGAD